MKKIKINRNKVLILLIYVVSIIILLWLLFISFKDLVTSFNSQDDSKLFFVPNPPKGGFPTLIAILQKKSFVGGKFPLGDLGVSNE
jgi:heme/copper-type cytochrome/quinol oxidase subunit 2